MNKILITLLGLSVFRYSLSLHLAPENKGLRVKDKGVELVNFRLKKVR